jgi:hypothetical protein
MLGKARSGFQQLQPAPTRPRESLGLVRKSDEDVESQRCEDKNARGIFFSIVNASTTDIE